MNFIGLGLNQQVATRNWIVVELNQNQEEKNII